MQMLEKDKVSLSKTYDSNCPKCRKITLHLTHSLSKTKGLKLRCSKCGKIKCRYYQINKLLEFYQENLTKKTGELF